ncbi:hypothetical protein ON010_g6001 [Phytophthora cinnamomi]|nr:hypothetical protein ON010_g6001 [Phytophthora cinnamomi]
MAPKISSVLGFHEREQLHKNLSILAYTGDVGQNYLDLGDGYGNQEGQQETLPQQRGRSRTNSDKKTTATSSRLASISTSLHSARAAVTTRAKKLHVRETTRQAISQLRKTMTKGSSSRTDRSQTKESEVADHHQSNQSDSDHFDSDHVTAMGNQAGVENVGYAEYAEQPEAAGWPSSSRRAPGSEAPSRSQDSATSSTSVLRVVPFSYTLKLKLAVEVVDQNVADSMASPAKATLGCYPSAKHTAHSAGTMRLQWCLGCSSQQRKPPANLNLTVCSRDTYAPRAAAGRQRMFMIQHNPRQSSAAACVTVPMGPQAIKPIPHMDGKIRAASVIIPRASMRDSRRVKAEPLGQVTPRKRASSGGFSTEASSSSEMTEPLVPKDRQLGYGSTTPEVEPQDDGGDVVVSDQVLVSAIANLSTAVRRDISLIEYMESAALTDSWRVLLSTTWR